MNVWKFSIPIDSYYGDEVFYKEIYFIGEYCPTHEQVVNRLRELADDEQKMSMEFPCTFEYKQCLDTIGGNKLPHLAGNLIETNTRIIHPKWGDQYIDVQKICLHDVNEPFVSWYDGGREY